MKTSRENHSLISHHNSTTDN